MLCSSRGGLCATARSPAASGMIEQAILTTDGACIRNPGPGGWAYVLRYQGHVTNLSGTESDTTNNRMELRAVIEGLRGLKEPCVVVVRTDSQYVKNGMMKWIRTWKSNGWVHREKGKAGWHLVKNRDLWEELERLQGMHQITWKWVKGHADDADNKRCHLLANAEARTIITAAKRESPKR